VDCAVQGERAPDAIVAALRRLNEFAASRLPADRQHEAIDVLIVARGGGAPEELAVFSDERVARAIFASAIPVVSAIGHETDYTIADLVADVRAPTPSVAAELVAPDLYVLRETLAEQRRRLAMAASAVVQEHRRRVANLAQQLQWQSPRARLGRDRQRVAELAARARLLMRQTLAAHAARVETRRLQLLALSPADTLARGYALCYDQHGAVVTDAARVQAGDAVAVRLHRGALRANVESATSLPAPAPDAPANGQGVADERQPTVV
jgi:exodeoxyribonuclease VII large subunit